MKRENAEILSDLLLDISDKLARSVQKSKEALDDADFISYRRQVAEFMGITIHEKLTRIFQEYPDMKPEEWN